MPYYPGPHIPVEHCPAGTSTDETVDAEVVVIGTALMTTIVTQGDKDFTTV